MRVESRPRGLLRLPAARPSRGGTVIAAPFCSRRAGPDQHPCEKEGGPAPSRSFCRSSSGVDHSQAATGHGVGPKSVGCLSILTPSRAHLQSATAARPGDEESAGHGLAAHPTRARALTSHAQRCPGMGNGRLAAARARTGHAEDADVRLFDRGRLADSLGALIRGAEPIRAAMPRPAAPPWCRRVGQTLELDLLDDLAALAELLCPGVTAARSLLGRQ